jgi:hypothetical protein
MLNSTKTEQIRVRLLAMQEEMMAIMKASLEKIEALLFYAQ